MMNSDFKEMLSLLNEYNARYLVVGGYALIEYTEPRFTKDLDIWIATDSQNAECVYRALAAFGAPLAGVSPADFTRNDSVFQIGISPVRVDVLMSVDGVEFEEAWASRATVDFDGVKTYLISRQDLLKNKIASGRPQDLIDAKMLSKSENRERD